MAGDPALKDAFESIRRAVLILPRDRDQTCAALADMRRRRQEKHTDPIKEVVTDIQFIAELGVLLHAAEQPQLTENRRSVELLAALAAHGWLDSRTADRLQQAWHLAISARISKHLERNARCGLSPATVAQVDETFARMTLRA